MAKMLTVAIASLSALLVTASAFAQTRQSPFAPLADVVAEEMKTSGTPGAAVAVVIADRVVFARGFGVTSVETQVPVDADTLFRIASTTKMFTAAAVAVEADRGTLDLDAPAGRYVSGLPRGVGVASLRDLLTHRAGMRDETVYYGRHDDSELAALVRGWRDDVQFAPARDVSSYSNLGYDLAGYVLERRTGRALADELRSALFDPLGMKRSTLRPVEAMTSRSRRITKPRPPVLSSCVRSLTTRATGPTAGCSPPPRNTRASPSRS